LSYWRNYSKRKQVGFYLETKRTNGSLEECVIVGIKYDIREKKITRPLLPPSLSA
jgi:hypothetical protein